MALQQQQLAGRPVLSSNRWAAGCLFRLLPHVSEGSHSCSGLPRRHAPLVLGVGHIPHKLHLPDILEQGGGDDPGGLPHLHWGRKGKL